MLSHITLNHNQGNKTIKTITSIPFQLDKDFKKLVEDTEDWRGEKVMVRQASHKTYSVYYNLPSRVLLRPAAMLPPYTDPHAWT